MGHRNSPAQFGPDGRIFEAHGGSDQDPASLAAGRGALNTPIADQPSVAARFILLLVRLYIALLSPILGGACKFHPSCSNYAREAVSLHGARRGTVLALKRLGRCRPFTRGGFDPVPDAEELNAHNSAGIRIREGVQ